MLGTLREKSKFCVLVFVALPGPILQSILPLLNIYYLERIEETALKKGKCLSHSFSVSDFKQGTMMSSGKYYT